MDQRRSNKRVRTLLDGRIVFNDRFSLIECTVRDLSDTGAQIAFAHPIEPPPEFELEIPKKGLSVRARVMWSKGKQHGVMFIEGAHEKAHSEVHVSRDDTSPPTGSVPEQAVSAPSSSRVQEILDEARHQIAQAMGVPAEAIRLKLEIAH
jgi:hypothetical protein